jgi:hypothetical protein
VLCHVKKLPVVVELSGLSCLVACFPRSTSSTNCTINPGSDPAQSEPERQRQQAGELDVAYCAFGQNKREIITGGESRGFGLTGNRNHANVHVSYRSSGVKPCVVWALGVSLPFLALYGVG